MKIKPCLLGFTVLVILFSSSFSFGQSKRPKDLDNPHVLEAQKLTTSKILRLLEGEKLENLLKYIDSNYLATKTVVIKSTLAKASKEIQKVKSFAEVSEGLMVFQENHNVSRCIYFKGQKEFFLIDIHYNEGDPNSKIVKITTKDSKQLSIKKAERENWTKKNPLPPQMN